MSNANWRGPVSGRDSRVLPTPEVLGKMDAESIYVAAVIATDGIRFATAGHTRDEVLSAVATYVRERSAVQLWPDRARLVRDYLDRGECEAGIGAYFATVGDRWDQEWIITMEVPRPPAVQHAA